MSKENQKRDIVSKDKLLEAGVYFGHKKDKWNPKMKPYILTTKKGTHIIDIDKTKKTLEFAYSLVRNYAEKGASFVFVGTRKQAKEAVKSNALRTNSYYVSERWLGGTLTNSRTIFQRVRRMFDLERLAENNYDGYTKKEGLLFSKELAKLQKNLSGIKTMKRKPNVMIVADPKADDIAVKEAKKLGVKVIGIVDTNNDPSDVNIAIPGNDDSAKSITLILTILADAIASAKGGTQLFAYQPDEAIVLPEEPKKEYKKPFNKRNSFRRPNPRFNNNRDNNQSRENKDFKKPVAKTEAPKVEAPKVEAHKVEAPKTEAPAQDLSALKVAELREIAKAKSVTGYSTMKKAELVSALS